MHGVFWMTARIFILYSHFLLYRIEQILSGHTVQKLGIKGGYVEGDINSDHKSVLKLQ